MGRSSGVRARIAIAIALAGSAAVLAVRTVHAQSPGSNRVPVNVMVVHTCESERDGGVDPRARDLDEKLKKQLRYKSMRVIQQERVDLEMNQVGTVHLPDGRKVRMRPIHKDTRGVLMAVDVQGAVKLDARAPNHHKVVIGAGEYEDGNLAVSIEPDYNE
ncbi:MAG TPA: hypothetical protein VKH41_01215 [Myxococcota bacterium]|nr:hypothetical protein [Myxococcota bacterium]